MKLIQLFLLPVALLLSMPVFAQKAGQECFPEKALRLVYDEAGVLSSSEKSQLENELVMFSDSTSNQIAVVIVNDLCGMEKAQFAIELGQAWGVGQAKEDNGIVMLIKVKTASSKGEAFIAVGRGLEGAIPDATALQIIDREMIPAFRNNNYSGGIEAGVHVLMELAQGEYDSNSYSKGKTVGAGTILFIVFGVIFVIILAFGLRAYQVKKYARVNNIGFWVAWALLNNIQRQHTGSWSDFNRGRGGFGGWSGGGGGGFGGFGGGSFGGGGAGGSW
jgi:uncharacterized protein